MESVKIWKKKSLPSFKFWISLSGVNTFSLNSATVSTFFFNESAAIIKYRSKDISYRVLESYFFCSLIWSFELNETIRPTNINSSQSKALFYWFIGLITELRCSAVPSLDLLRSLFDTSVIKILWVILLFLLKIKLIIRFYHCPIDFSSIFQFLQKI